MGQPIPRFHPQAQLLVSVLEQRRKSRCHPILTQRQDVCFHRSRHVAPNNRRTSAGTGALGAVGGTGAQESVPSAYREPSAGTEPCLSVRSRKNWGTTT